MALDVMARKKDTTLSQLKGAIISNGANTTDLARDVTEFIEVLNQKQIRKFKRKAYKMKMKNVGCKEENNVKLEKNLVNFNVIHVHQVITNKPYENINSPIKT